MGPVSGVTTAGGDTEVHGCQITVKFYYKMSGLLNM